MGVILRLTSKAVWDEEGGDPAKAAKHFERRDVDTDGVSVFETEDDAEREVLVAAIACGRRKTEPIDLLEVSREEVEKHGKIQSTPGDLPVSAANRFHRLLDWPADDLRRFAEAVFASRPTVRRHGALEIRSAVRKLDVADVEEGDAREFVLRVKTAPEPKGKVTLATETPRSGPEEARRDAADRRLGRRVTRFNG